MDRPTVLLMLGALAGIAAAASALVSGSVGGVNQLSSDDAARVNGQVIRRVDYARMLTAVAGDKRSPMQADDRRHILDRLIEEELLVQRALELGLAYHDSRVRKDLTAAIIDSIVAEARDADPSEDELERFYAEQKEFFTGADQLRVRQIWVRVAALADANAAFERAKQAVARLRAGEDFDQVRSALGDAEVVPLPAVLLPLAKLSDYLGPTPLRVVMDLPVDEISEPIRSSTGYHVLQVLERAAAPAPPLADIREQVLEAYRRKQGDDALRAYLDDLRSRAVVRIAPDLPR